MQRLQRGNHQHQPALHIKHAGATQNIAFTQHRHSLKGAQRPHRIAMAQQQLCGPAAYSLHGPGEQDSAGLAAMPAAHRKTERAELVRQQVKDRLLRGRDLRGQFESGKGLE